MYHQFKFILIALILHKFRRGENYLFVLSFTDDLGLPDSEYDKFVRFLKEKHIYVTSKTKLELDQDHIKVKHYDILIDWGHDPKAKEYLEGVENTTIREKK